MQTSRVENSIAGRSRRRRIVAESIASESIDTESIGAESIVAGSIGA